LEEVVANYTAVDLPLEVVWSDIEYMSTRFWTMEFDECE
jgi:alpha-glucosidase (family GH31 glycosyl hydrolase)